MLQTRNREWHALKTRLKDEGFQVDNQEDEASALTRAVVGFLTKCPACMAGLSLDDLAGEREPVNIPGVGQDRHRSWSRRMTMTLEEITASRSIRETLGTERA